MKRFYIVFTACFVAAGLLWAYRSGTILPQSAQSPAVTVNLIGPELEPASLAAVVPPSQNVEFQYELHNGSSVSLRGLRAKLF